MNDALMWACDPTTGACSMHLSTDALTAIGFVLMVLCFGLGIQVFK